MFFSTLYNTRNVTTLLLTSNNEHKNLICCIFVYIYVSFYLDTVENTIYNDDGEIFKFTMLSSTLVKHFPSEKLDKLKFLIKSKFSHLYNLKLLIKTKWYFFFYFNYGYDLKKWWNYWFRNVDYMVKQNILKV